jgi:hypothetical protein
VPRSTRSRTGEDVGLPLMISASTEPFRRIVSTRPAPRVDVCRRKDGTVRAWPRPTCHHEEAAVLTSSGRFPRTSCILMVIRVPVRMRARVPNVRTLVLLLIPRHCRRRSRTKPCGPSACVSNRKQNDQHDPTTRLVRLEVAIRGCNVVASQV